MNEKSNQYPKRRYHQRYKVADIRVAEMLRQSYGTDSVNISISMPIAIYNRIDELKKDNRMSSRSLAICFIIHHGLARILQLVADEHAEQKTLGAKGD